MLDDSQLVRVGELYILELILITERLILKHKGIINEYTVRIINIYQNGQDKFGLMYGCY